MDIEVQPQIFEARMLAESIAVGLAHANYAANSTPCAGFCRKSMRCWRKRKPAWANSAMASHEGCQTVANETTSWHLKTLGRNFWRVERESDTFYLVCVCQSSSFRTRKLKLARNEKTSAKVASVASKGLKDPKSVSPKQVKSVSAAALTQAPDKRPAPKSAPKKK